MVTRSINRNWQRNSGTLVESFNTTTGFTPTKCSLTVTDDLFDTGYNTLTLTTSDATNSNFSIRKTVSIDLGGGELFGIYIYTEDLPLVQQVILKFYTTTKLIRSPTFNIGGNYPEGGFYLQWHKDDMSYESGATSHDQIVLMDVVIPRLTGSATVTLGPLTFGVEYTPCVVFSFDDGVADIYTKQYPILSAKGMKGTVYLNSDTTGEDGYLTTTQLTTLYNEGWSICNHTDDHTDLDTYETGEEIEAHIMGCKDYLDNLGFTATSKHFAYPHGAYNTLVLSTIDSMGEDVVATAMSVTTLPHQTTVIEDQRILLSRRGLSSSVSLEDAKGWIDTTIKEQKTCFILCHELDADGTWTTAQFQALIDYVESRAVKCLTIEEWYERLTEPRYTRSPITRTLVSSRESVTRT